MDKKDSEIYQSCDDGFVVRRMRREDEPQVIRWLVPLINLSVDLEIILDMRGDDDDGFYVGELSGEVTRHLWRHRLQTT